MKRILVLMAMLPLVAAAQPTAKTLPLPEPIYAKPCGGKGLLIPGPRKASILYALDTPVNVLTADDSRTLPASEVKDATLPPQPRGCGTHLPSHYYRDRSGTLYFIDGVKVETVGPIAKQCTIQAREPVFIDRVDLRMDMNNPTTLVLQRQDIMKLPYTDLTDMVSLSLSVHQQQRGAANHISAGRPEDILYVIDGMQVARW